MTEGEISLAFSALGIVFGLIGAYGRLKLMVEGAARFSNSAAERYLSRQAKQVRVFLQSPSALIAYLAQVAIQLALILSIAVGLYILIVASLEVSRWYARAVLWLSCAWVGAKLGLVLAMLEAVNTCSSESGDALSTLVKQHPKA